MIIFVNHDLISVDSVEGASVVVVGGKISLNR